MIKLAQAFLRARQDLWQKLSQDILHPPAGNFNCPLQAAFRNLGSYDPRFAKGLQTDR